MSIKLGKGVMYCTNFWWKHDIIEFYCRTSNVGIMSKAGLKPLAKKINELASVSKILNNWNRSVGNSAQLLCKFLLKKKITVLPPLLL